MAKSAKEKLEEIAELQAMIDAMPDSDEEIPEEEDSTPSESVTAETLFANKPSRYPNRVVEIRTRRVREISFSSLKTELVCEECRVTFYEHLPTLFDGRLCGTNCAEIVLEKARDLLEQYAPFAIIEHASLALLNTDPAHLRTDGPLPSLVPARSEVDIIREEMDAYEASQGSTLAEKIRAKLGE